MGGLCHCSSGWKKEALAFFPLLSLEILQKDLKASKSNGMVQQDGHRKKNNALPWRESNKGRPLINGRHHLLLEWKDNKIQVVELLKATLETRQVVQTNNKIRREIFVLFEHFC